MDYMDFVIAALAAVAMSSLVYVGMAAMGRQNLASLEIDMIVLAAIATFISVMIANHPEWLS